MQVIISREIIQIVDHKQVEFTSLSVDYIIIIVHKVGYLWLRCIMMDQNSAKKI